MSLFPDWVFDREWKMRPEDDPDYIPSIKKDPKGFGNL
jgi:hypothetical protein